MNSTFTFPDESKNRSSFTLPFDLTCCCFFFLGDDGDLQVADCHFCCGSYGKHVFSPGLIRLINITALSALLVRSPIASVHAILNSGLAYDARNTVLGNTIHVQVIRRNFVADTMTNPCCCDFIYSLAAGGKHQHCNFLDIEFSSDRSWWTGTLIIFQIASSLANICAT
jgi:hypothetical protein